MSTAIVFFVAYHAKLQEAGVQSEHVVFKGTIHGFIARPGKTILLLQFCAKSID